MTSHFTNPNPTPDLNFLSSGQSYPEIGETLARNDDMLSTGIKPAVDGDGMAVKNYESQRVFAFAMILYVDSSTGRIEGIGSHEKIARAKSRTSPETELSAIEAEVTGLSTSLLDDPTTSRINAWFEEALITAETEPGEWRTQRPESWTRNSRVRISQNSLINHPLEEAIPEDIERGIFLKSIDEYNQKEESDVFKPEDHEPKQ